MGTYHTLEYDGTERTLAGWGIAQNGISAEFTSLRPDQLRLSIPSAAATSDPVFAYLGQVILRLNRTSADGTDNSFSSGAVEFIGYRTGHVVDARPDAQALHYTFVNAFFILEQTLFQQKRANIPTTYPDLTYKYTSDLSLFCKLGSSNEFVKLTNGEQITEVLQFVLDNPPSFAAVPYIIGTIDPGINVPTFQCSEVSCAMVIQKALEVSPDCTVYFDYSTESGGDPCPTIHVRKRANLTPVSLAYLNGTDHQSLALRPCYEIVPASVLIFYKLHSETDGVSFVELLRDKYGPNGANSGSDPDAGFQVAIQTFDLAGPVTSNLSSVLEVETCDVNHATQATRLAWWAKRERKLQNTDLCEVVAGTYAINDATIVASHDQPGGITAGDTISLVDYPNVLLDGVIMDWMVEGSDPVVGVRVTIKTDMVVDFQKRATTSSNWNPDRQVLSLQTQVTLTNGSSGTYTISGGSLGEDVPEGVAEEIYNALATLQYEGQDVRVAAAPVTSVGMANTLNLTGGRSEWTTMNAQIQRVARDYGNGQTSLSIGPARHISGGDIVALCLFNRTRRVRESNTVRVTGQP